MDFFNDMSVPAKFLLAFIVVLAVLGAAGYLMRRFSGGTLVTSGARGRQPRLGVIDAASVDGRRRLVLVRRDNVEHLLLIGGPIDIVVEPNIGRATVVAAAPAAPPLRDAKVSPALESLPRQPPPLEGSGWPPSEPAYMEPPPPPRPVRERQRLESLVEDVGAPPLTPPPEIEPAFQPPPAPPPYEPVFQIPPPPEPKRMPAAPPLPPRATQSEESNLAEMAQRLEAALRRPAEPVAPPVAPETPPAGTSRSEPPVPAPAPQKSGFENLEDEMASLLGRPKNPS
jgi:flagellar biogenesis protein FliO